MENNSIEKTLEALRAKRDRLSVTIETLEAILKESSSKVVDETYVATKATKATPVNNYDVKLTVPEKFMFFLKQERRFLHFREAAELIVAAEGKGDAKSLARKLATATVNLKKAGIIVKVQHGTSFQNTFWGSPKWLDEKGEIIPAFKYNEEFVAKATPTDPSLFEF